MAVNAPRFRVYRGRVMDMDSANVLNIGTKIAAASTTVVSSQIHGFPVAGAEQGLTLQNISIKNDGNANDFFVGGLIENSSNTNWQAGTWSGAGTGTGTYAVDSDGAAVAASSGNNTGLVVAADRPFTAVVFDCSTTKDTSGGDWVETLTYWDGDSWNDLTPYLIVSPTLNGTISTSHLFATTDEQLVLFSPPQDWAKITSTTRPDTSESDLDGFYAIRWLSTTSQTQKPVVATFNVGSLRSAYMGMGKTSALVAETQHTPLCSAAEAPWFVMGSVHGGGDVTVFMTVEKNNFTGTIGE